MVFGKQDVRKTACNYSSNFQTGWQVVEEEGVVSSLCTGEVNTQVIRARLVRHTTRFR